MSVDLPKPDRDSLSMEALDDHAATIGELLATTNSERSRFIETTEMMFKWYTQKESLLEDIQKALQGLIEYRNIPAESFQQQTESTIHNYFLVSLRKTNRLPRAIEGNRALITKAKENEAELPPEVKQIISEIEQILETAELVNTESEELKEQIRTLNGGPKLKPPQLDYSRAVRITVYVFDNQNSLIRHQASTILQQDGGEFALIIQAISQPGREIEYKVLQAEPYSVQARVVTAEFRTIIGQEEGPVQLMSAEIELQKVNQLVVSW